MKLLRPDESPRVRATDPMFVGEVYRQNLTGDLGQHLRVSLVSFQSGARNTFHTHASDQILIITEGEGIVATETEERPVTAGEIVFFRAGERHWHGAQPGRAMAHLSIQAVR